MNERPPDHSPFDEQAALDELERVRKEIGRFQAERKAVDLEFERFLQSFKEPKRSPEAPAPKPPASLVSVPPVAFDPAVLDEHEDVAPALPEPFVVKPAPVAPPPQRSGTRRSVVVGGVLILLTASGVATWTILKGRNATPAASTAPPTPAGVPAAIPEVGASEPAVPAPPQRSPFESEITTTSAVWVRVIADGERVLERELPAGARVPFRAEKTIVIRTGDAGAIRLSIGGQDRGPLGRVGDVVTRTFTVPAARPR